VRFLAEKGIRAQIGHTLATYEQGLQALESGACGFTHLFNAMTPLNHRAPGIVGTALAHADYCELIPDLVHVHPGALLAALRAIPKAYCVSDSTAGAGMLMANIVSAGSALPRLSAAHDWPTAPSLAAP